MRALDSNDNSWICYPPDNRISSTLGSIYFLIYFYFHLISWDCFCIFGTDGYLLARSGAMDILYTHLGVWHFNTRLPAFFNPVKKPKKILWKGKVFETKITLFSPKWVFDSFFHIMRRHFSLLCTGKLNLIPFFA